MTTIRAMMAVAAACLFSGLSVSSARECARDNELAELRTAVYASLHTGLPGEPRCMDVDDLAVQLRGGTALVSFRLTEFLSCEEGSPYQTVRRLTAWERDSRGAWVQKSDRVALSANGSRW